MEPCLGSGPIAFHGSRRDAEYFRRFLDGQASKKSEFDHSALVRASPIHSMRHRVRPGSNRAARRVGGAGTGERFVEAHRNQRDETVESAFIAIALSNQ